jgi:hypothetical protein
MELRMKNETANGKARLESLLAKEKQLHQALAAERLKVAKREKREAEKEEALIGAAVVKASALSPEFKLAVGQVALLNITDEKHRAFLRGRGWEV